MNEKLKQRLVGAVILVSLAIIFIPMLLDGGERSSMPMFGSNIPDKPDYQFEPLEIPLQQVPPIAEERPVLIDKPESAPEQTADAKEKPSEDAPASREASTEEPPRPKTEAASTATKPAPSALTENEQVAWVVQVGSFSQSSNALSLRDKLRAKGFTAFVEKVKTDRDIIYRVRIGPELKRENADKQLQRLQRVMKMKGIVMGHNS